ncbi:MAG TPA: hypothetical protein ENG45_00120 [Candidatus Aenigmarchaeota archaeon]|nr:hypothetical protein [Candidatus Aenigmarchaeota archaeon]
MNLKYALKCYKKIFKNPRDVDAWLDLANYFLEINLPLLTINHTFSAGLINPRDKRVYLIRAEAFAKIKDYLHATIEIINLLLIERRPNPEIIRDYFNVVWERKRELEKKLFERVREYYLTGKYSTLFP